MEFGITLEKEPTEAVKALTSSNIDKLVTPVDTQFKFYEKRSIFEEHPVFLQVLKMVNSYFVWVGTVPPIMSSLLLSVPHAQVRHVALDTVLVFGVNFIFANYYGLLRALTPSRHRYWATKPTQLDRALQRNLVRPWVRDFLFTHRSFQSLHCDISYRINSGLVCV